MPDDQVPADELDRIIDMLQEAGLIQAEEQADGRVLIRLTERGEELRAQLPDEMLEAGDGTDDEA